MSFVPRAYAYPTLKLDNYALAQLANSPTLCPHTTTELRKKTDVTGRPRLHNQCITCGKRVGNRVSAKGYAPEFVESRPDVDEELVRSLWAEYHERLEPLKAAEMKRLLGEWRAFHQTYLKTVDWRFRREPVLRRAQGCCERCHVCEPLEVHHLHYDTAGNETPEDLIAVCRDCHEFYHLKVPEVLEREAEDDEDLPW